MIWLILNALLGIAKITREFLATLWDRFLVVMVAVVFWLAFGAAVAVIMSGCAHWLTEEGWHGTNRPANTMQETCDCLPLEVHQVASGQ